MTCLEARDLLAEYAVDALSQIERRRVDRHLDSCTGCAKEAGAFRESITAAVLELPAVAPPVALEGRVVTRITGETRRRAGRRRSAARALWVAAASAALLAAGALGGAFAMRGQVQDLQQQVHSTRVTLSQVQDLIQSLSAKGRVTQVQLVPLDRHAGAEGGSGIIFSSPQEPDWMFLQVAIAHPSSGPYRVVLATKGGRTVDGGTLQPLGKDQYVMDGPAGPRTFTESLGQIAVVIVLDPDGRPLLRGFVRPSAGS
jgi:anti-sigma factor RsiW